MTRRLRCCDLVTALLLVLVTARPVHACCAVSSSGLAFGTYQSLTFAGKLSSADVSSAGIVSVVCSGIATGGDYTIALGPSMAGSGDRISTRYLANPNGGELMMFNVYTDYNRSTVWGDGTTGAVLSGSIAAGASNQSQAVYGKIPAGQYRLRAGGFSSALTMTVTYNP